MTDFDTLQNRLWADVLAKLGGVDAVFTPLTGEPSSFKVLFTESMQLQPSGMSQTWLQVTPYRIFTCRPAQGGQWSVRPSR